MEVPECRMQEDVSHLFETGQFTDCKITSDDGKKEFKVKYRIFNISKMPTFKVHKIILGCRSPVFAAMFQHRVTENDENVINIVDIRGDVIEKMLHFMFVSLLN